MMSWVVYLGVPTLIAILFIVLVWGDWSRLGCLLRGRHKALYVYYHSGRCWRCSQTICAVCYRGFVRDRQDGKYHRVCDRCIRKLKY